MSDDAAKVRVYFAPLSYPCGPQSSCCGPAGQSDEEVAALQRAVEEGLDGIELEVIDVSKPLQMARDAPVIRLLKSFGTQACPIVTVGEDVVSMGPAALTDLMPLVAERVHSGPAH